MPEFEITDEGLAGFANALLTLWGAIGKSQPSLDTEREHGRDIARALVGGMLLAYRHLFGREEMTALRRKLEEMLKGEVGYVPGIKLESGGALAAFFAAAQVDWTFPDEL